MSILINILLAILVIVCILMVLVVLMQRPKNEGLGAAFGGGMTENLFGAQTSNVLAKFTVYLGVTFFVLTLTLSYLYAKQNRPEITEVQKELQALPKPVVTPTPSPAATSPAAPAGAAATDTNVVPTVPATEGAPTTEIPEPNTENAKPAEAPAAPATEAEPAAPAVSPAQSPTPTQP